MHGRSPAEVFAQERDPAARPAPAEEQLILASLEHDSRKVNNARIELFGHGYVPRTPEASAAIFLRNGQTVHIAYHRLDPGHCWVMDDDGTVICQLHAERLNAFAPNDEATQAQIAGSMQQRNQLAKNTRRAHSNLTRAARAIGGRMPVEGLAQRALDAAPVQDDRAISRAVSPRVLRNRASSAPRKLHAADIAADFFAAEGDD